VTSVTSSVPPVTVICWLFEIEPVDPRASVPPCTVVVPAVGVGAGERLFATANLRQRQGAAAIVDQTAEGPGLIVATHGQRRKCPAVIQDRARRTDAQALRDR
jgi:hypothetical protein